MEQSRSARSTRLPVLEPQRAVSRNAGGSPRVCAETLRFYIPRAFKKAGSLPPDRRGFIALRMMDADWSRYSPLAQALGRMFTACDGTRHNTTGPLGPSRVALPMLRFSWGGS